jgi:hypothetical protein
MMMITGNLLSYSIYIYIYIYLFIYIHNCSTQWKQYFVILIFMRYKHRKFEKLAIYNQVCYNYYYTFTCICTHGIQIKTDVCRANGSILLN